MAQKQPFKYGLQLRRGPTKQEQENKKKKVAAAPLALFANEEDDGIESEIIKEGHKKRLRKEVR